MPCAKVVGLVGLAVVLGGAANACGGHLGRQDGAAIVADGGPGTFGSGGTLGSGGTTGSGGAAGPGAPSGGAAAGGRFGEPACPSGVAEGSACAPTDLQFCYRPCGPEMTGVRSETCRSSGLYGEMVGCSYDLSRDYSCYRIPLEPVVGCGQTPQAGNPCELAPCTPCNSRGGEVDGEYASAGGAISTGWCVCQQPDAAGVRTWSCANATQWPCPIGRGC